MFCLGIAYCQSKFMAEGVADGESAGADSGDKRAVVALRGFL